MRCDVVSGWLVRCSADLLSLYVECFGEDTPADFWLQESVLIALISKSFG